MSAPRLATLCLVTCNERWPAFRAGLDRLLTVLPAPAVELRLGFHQAATILHYTLGLLCPDHTALEHTRLPQGIERFRSTVSAELSLGCWSLPACLPAENCLRWLWCDLPLTTEYVVWLDDVALGQDDWWPEVSAALRGGADVVATTGWSDFLAGEEEWLRSQPWYRGVPFRTRQGRPGVEAYHGPWLAWRVACLRQAGLLDSWFTPDGRAGRGRVFVWLAEMTHQLGWRPNAVSRPASPRGCAGENADRPSPD